MRGIGCEVFELDCNLDFTFPKYNPNPEDLKMLHAISKAVKDNNADIGFGFDGDGDRCGVIDNDGNEIFSDKIGLLIARNLSNSYKNSKFIVVPIFYGSGMKTKVAEAFSYGKTVFITKEASIGYEKNFDKCIIVNTLLN